MPSPGLEFVFDTVLKAFPFDLHSGYDETVADEMARVSNALVGAKAVQIRLFLLDVDSGDGVESQPRRKGPSALIWPSLEGRQRNRLVVFVGILSLFPREREKLLRSLTLWELPDRFREVGLRGG